MTYHDQSGSFKFSKRADIDKALTTMQGILRGINADQQINQQEVKEFLLWFDMNGYLLDQDPFREIKEHIEFYLADGQLTSEEIEDVCWKCEQLPIHYYQEITRRSQELMGVMHGLIADGRLRDQEIIGFRNWMHNNFELAGNWPYDELYNFLTRILEDGWVSEAERLEFKAFLQQFVILYDVDMDSQVRTEVQGVAIDNNLCAIDPKITFFDRVFCFTGISSRAPRSEIINVIKQYGGNYSDFISKKINYLVVGDSGNRNWAYSCFGRKVEKVMRYRQEGCPIIIVHEYDFWDAVEDGAIV